MLWRATFSFAGRKFWQASRERRSLLPTMEVTMNGRQFILVWVIILGLSMLVWSGVGYVLGVL